MHPTVLTQDFEILGLSDAHLKKKKSGYFWEDLQSIQGLVC